LESKMVAIAAMCSAEGVVPEDIGCCGFAGDRGFLHPELTESATRSEALEVAGMGPRGGHYSTSRTCEVGMSTATEQPYSSIIHLVRKALAD
jgi:D-lactate dehydrogenase